MDGAVEKKEIGKRTDRTDGTKESVKELREQIRYEGKRREQER